MKHNALHLDRFNVFYQNKEELLVIKKEIFSQHCYYTELSTATPYIIDAGAHIGLATLYFKKQYPGAHILAIEPHPENFDLLEKNVWENNLRDVETIQAALSSQEGDLELHADASSTWLSTTSVEPNSWNGQQPTQPIKVPAITLSSLINQPVDILKLDIEGSELDVLLEAGSTLDQVTNIFVEFHPTPSQSWQDLTHVLKSHGFALSYSKDGAEVKPHHGLGLILIHAQRKLGDSPTK